MDKKTTLDLGRTRIFIFHACAIYTCFSTMQKVPRKAEKSHEKKYMLSHKNEKNWKKMNDGR